MHSLDEFATAKLAELESNQLRRTLSDSTRVGGIWVERDGRRLLSFSCNDYLNLSGHPAVIEAAVQATRQHGVGSGASRLITGNYPLLGDLEARLAALKGTEAACVFGSGYLANSGIIPVLAGRDDLVLIDEWAHACLFSGTQLTRGASLVFRHNDIAHVDELLTAQRAKHQRVLIVTDGVFSMDGDLAPVAELAALARRHDAWLMTDDAHGLGVIANGRGSSFADGTRADVPLQMGTLSKAVGGYGGYLCASKPVVELMRNRARTFVYSTALPPATTAAAIAALDIIANDAELTARPLAKARAFTRALNLPDAQSPIVPVIVGDEAKTLTLSRMLLDEGFLVAPIRPPTVPPGTARLRFAFTAGHPDDAIARLAALVRERVMAEIR
jgi:8-amino-7-oxononanoate synthase